MEKCFSSMVSSTSARASGVMHYPHYHSFAYSQKQDKKVNNFLPNSCKTGKTVAAVSFSSSSCNPRRGSIVCKASVDQVQVVNDNTWESLVVGCEVPVVVDFWAPWCGPCRMIAPIIDELAKEYAGKVMCYKINTDDCPNVAAKYGIRSIPTVLFFKDGEKKESIIGAVPKSTLTATIEKYI